ncbi:hypothetical protein Dimus_005598 [Dionaea muscipula]
MCLATALRNLVAEEGVNQFAPRSMVENRDWKNGIALSYEEYVGEELVFSDAYVASELAYWQEGVIGYMLGDRVLFSTMEGFVR